MYKMYDDPFYNAYSAIRQPAQAEIHLCEDEVRSTASRKY